MKKTYKIDVDCANCANKMEEAAKNTAGVEDATVNFMMLKMIVEFEDGQDPKSVMQNVLKNCKKLRMTARSSSKIKNFHTADGRKSWSRIDSKTCLRFSSRKSSIFSLEQRIWICKSLG